MCAAGMRAGCPASRWSLLQLRRLQRGSCWHVRRRACAVHLRRAPAELRWPSAPPASLRWLDYSGSAV